MEQLPNDPVLLFNPNQLKDVRETFNYNDLRRLNQDINLLEEWIKKQNHFTVKQYDREYLERYLIRSKGQVERAKKYLEKICTFRSLMPDYLIGIDVKNEFIDVIKTFHLCLLPKPTLDNYRIVFSTAHNPDTYETFDFIKYSRLLTVIEEYTYCYDYSMGYEIVSDMRNFTLNLLPKLNPAVLTNNIMIMIGARGFRLKAIHLITGSRVVDTLINVIKQALSKKLAARIHIHESVESLHKYVPRKLLPGDYGGELATVKEIFENNFKAMTSEDFVKKLKFSETAVTDESKRISSSFSEMYSGTPGSFKVLNFD